MKFYVPLMGDEGRHLWNQVHNDLGARHRFASLRRIQALLWQGDAKDPESVVVGEELPGGRPGDVVLVILQSDAFPCMMFVCTLRTFMEKEAPVALALGKGWHVVDFDEDRLAPVRKRAAARRTGKRAP